MPIPAMSVAELQAAVEAAEFGPQRRPLDLHEGSHRAFEDAERRRYDLFGPSSSERYGMGYGYGEDRGVE